MVARKKEISEFPYEEFLEDLYIDLGENYLSEIFDLAVLWVEQNIMHNKKKQILELLSKDSNISLTQIVNSFNKKQSISKPAILKHLDYLVLSKILTSVFVITDRGREKMYNITKTGHIILKIIKVINIKQDIANKPFRNN